MLKDLIWIQGTPGYARATLVNMDGTEYTAIVTSIDGDDTSAAANNYKFTAWDRDSYEPKLDDATGAFSNDNALVSTDSKYNDLYLGYALYRVYTYDDGDVSLNGLGQISYLDEATVDTTTSAIIEGGTEVPVDNNTQFIVRTGTLASGYTYTAYNRNTLPASLRENVEVFYTFADYVYIKSYVPATLDGTHLFVTGNEAWHEVGSGNQWQMTANLDGEEYTLTTTATIKNTLQANVGKLFHVNISVDPDDRYGQITNVDLVNELTNNTDNCNYLSGGLNIRLNGNVLQGDDVSYDVEDAVIVSTKSDVTSVADLEKAIKKGYGIWVLVDDTASPYEHAAVVYVGEKLSDNVTTTVVAYDADGDELASGTLTTADDDLTLTLDEDVAISDIDKITVTAVHENGRLNISNTIFDDCGDPALTTTFLFTLKNSVDTNVTDGDRDFTFTTTSESGVTENYAVDVVTTNEVLASAVESVVNNADSGNILATDVTAYASLEKAIEEAETLPINKAANISITLNTAIQGARYANFAANVAVSDDVITSNGVVATLDSQAFTIDTSGAEDGANFATGDHLVLRLYDGTNVWYVVFNITVAG